MILSLLELYVKKNNAITSTNQKKLMIPSFNNNYFNFWNVINALVKNLDTCNSEKLVKVNIFLFFIFLIKWKIIKYKFKF